MCPKISQNHKQHVVGNAGRYQVSVWHFSAIPTSREHPDIESTDRYIQIASQAAQTLNLAALTQRTTARQVEGDPGDTPKSVGSQESSDARLPARFSGSRGSLSFLPVALILEVPGTLAGVFWKTQICNQQVASKNWSA